MESKFDYDSLNPEVKEEIARIFHPRKIHSGAKGKELMLWTKGSRSEISRIVIEGESQVENAPHYILKFNHLKKDYVIEKSVLTVANKYCNGLFPKLINTDSEILDSYRILILEIKEDDTLFDIMKSKESDYANLKQVVFEDICPFLNSVIKMQNTLLRYESEISNEIIKNSNGEMKSLEELDADKYAKRMYNAINTFIPNLKFEKVYDWLYNFSERYLVGKNKEKIRVVQEDGWGDHVTKNGIIDGNSIKKGSYIQQVACLLAHPFVYNKISETNIIKRLVEHYKVYNGIDERLEDLETELYGGFIYSNIRLASHKKENFNYQMKRALLSQIKSLYERVIENDDKNILNLIEHIIKK